MLTCPCQARAAAIAAAGTSGILISAGGPRYTASLAASLHVLRRHLGCTLPIEVAWQVGACEGCRVQGAGNAIAGYACICRKRELEHCRPPYMRSNHGAQFRSAGRQVLLLC